MTGRPEEAEVRELRDIYANGSFARDPRVVAVCDSWLAQGRVIEAARDPFLVILEAHPDAEPHVNAEMKRAADNFRAALAGVAEKP